MFPKISYLDARVERKHYILSNVVSFVQVKLGLERNVEKDEKIAKVKKWVPKTIRDPRPDRQGGIRKAFSKGVHP